MDLVQVEILGLVITHRYGSLKTGDILRTDAAFAKHLVEDCAAAKYVQPAETGVMVDDGRAGQDSAGAADTSTAGGEQAFDAERESEPEPEQAASDSQPAAETAAKRSRKAK